MAAVETIFYNGTVFDGHGFLPHGTCVRISGGAITAVVEATEATGRRPGAGGS